MKKNSKQNSFFINLGINVHKQVKNFFSRKDRSIKFILIIIAFILSLWIFNKILILPYSKIEISENVKKDIISPIGFSIEDEQRMRQLYSEKISKISPVFSVDIERYKIFQTSIANFFHYLDLIKDKKYYTKKKLLASKYYFCKKLTTDQWHRLFSVINYDELENYIIYKIRPYFYEGFINNSKEIEKIIELAKKKTDIIMIRNKDITINKNISQLRTVDNIVNSLVHNNHFQKDGHLLSLLLRTFLQGNLLYNSEASLDSEKKAIVRIAPIIRKIQKGEILYKKGDKLSKEDINFLRKITKFLSEEYRTRKQIGIFLLIFLLFLLFINYPVKKKNLFRTNDKNFILFIGYVAFLILLDFIYYAMKIFPNAMISEFLLPFSFYVYIITLFIDRKFGLYCGILISILAGIFFQNSLPLVLYGITNTIVTVSLTKNIIRRSSLFFSMLLIGLLSSSIGIAMDLIVGIKFLIIFKHFLIVILGNIFSYILLISLIPLFESMFDISTPFQIVELLSGNHELLKNLALAAPGTYQHSLSVSYLAEAAAKEINCDPMIAKVGAFFHDIGKIKNPDYFIENQISKKNPHDKKAPIMSAKVIRQHVVYGYELSLKHMLPKAVRNIILEHHGTSLISFFYNKALEKKNGDVIDENEFRYQGNKPSSKESAIIMFGDRVEAKSRLLKNYKYQNIKDMVFTTLEEILIKEEQLTDAPITLQELYTVANSFINTIQNMYHKRIEYEEENKG
ncbi:HDIG domain-containing protein [bacterium]|nr:HDIG domain-containing protein [bacterium]